MNWHLIRVTTELEVEMIWILNLWVSFFFYYAKNLNRPLIQMSSRRFAKNEHTSLKGHQYDVSQAPPMLKLVLTI